MSQNHGKRYSKAFKEEAVRLFLTSGKNAKQLAHELGMTGTSLATWTEAAIRHGDHPEPAKLDGLQIHYSVLKLENQHLKQELAILQQEREILKKSLGILPRKRSQKGMP